ncbi:AAA-ATPase [Glycine soja]|uniref:AAA-ATPase n=1 Tax=Glycine soja TaxID=3848 RepID=A0A445HU31_GLYSO|nr:AAA-ATPase [Glycine soja]
MSNSKSLLSAVASLAASAMLIRSITNEFIEEFQGMSKNQVFEAAEAYLGTKATLSSQRMVFGHAVVRNALLFSTTHHKERLDPGRMDMHIHLSYCSFSAFEQLAFNYLGISQHKLFEQIEGLLREVKVIGEGIQDINFSTARKCAVN